jgi:hypothetical protein
MWGEVRGPDSWSASVRVAIGLMIIAHSGIACAIRDRLQQASLTIIISR